MRYRHIATALALVCACSVASAGEMRGIWMHANQIKTRAETEQVVARIEAARLNAVFLLVWYWGGQAFYHSDLCAMGDGVEKGHDPLGAMVELCHKRGIEVHAWFVNGAYGAAEPGRVLEEHPDWAVKTGGGGQLWYDFGKPEVRKFQSDLMIECLRRYDLDGIHFDYIRYGPRQCLCEHCQATFARRTGYAPLTKEQTDSFPLVVACAGNPLAEPTTATVIATFGNGQPAIVLNTLGKGRVLLVNWHAEQDAPTAVSATLHRALTQWGAHPDRVVLMDSEPNRAKYGRRFTSAGVQWLRRLGWNARIAPETQLATLPKGTTLVLSCVYLVPKEMAEGIARFVEAGGDLVVIDGPVLSMQHEALQRVLGMRKQGSYFHATRIIRSTGKSDLAPSSSRTVDIEREQSRAEAWRRYRAWGVTALVRDVYRRAKALKPDAQVTAAVFTPLSSARHACQDWPGWLRAGIIDYVVPMAYTPDNKKLSDQFAEWKTLDPALERIVPGLCIYSKTPKGNVTRDIGLVLSQRKLSDDAGAHGNVYFSLHTLDNALTAALVAGPHATPATAYRPPARKSPFFALCHDTHDAKKRTMAQQAELLAELGFDGAGHLWLKGLPERLKTLDEKKLRLFQVYITVNIDPKKPACDPALKTALPLLQGRDVMLALLVTGGKPSSVEGDERAVAVLREIADLAAGSDVRVALYPHTNNWIETTEDAVRVAKKVDRENLGVMFNLCHWLKCGGEPATLEPLLREAAPLLFAVTLNGADTGLGRKGGWDRLIQPLGSGTFDNGKLLAILKRLGYTGPIGLQCYGLGGDAREHLTRSMAAWRAMAK